MKEKRKVWTRKFLAKSGDVFTKNALNCRRNDERKRIKIFALMKLKRKWQDIVIPEKQVFRELQSPKRNKMAGIFDANCVFLL